MSPAEKALRNMRENPKVLEYCARNFFRSQTGREYRAGNDEWEKLSEDERALWRAAVLDRQVEFAALTPAQRAKRHAQSIRSIPQGESDEQ